MKKQLIILAAALSALAAPAYAGQYCREYTQTVYIGGRAVEAYGTACQQPDGSWEKGPMRTANNVVITQPAVTTTPVVYQSVRYVERPSLLYVGNSYRYRPRYVSHRRDNWRHNRHHRYNHHSRNGGTLAVRW